MTANICQHKKFEKVTSSTTSMTKLSETADEEYVNKPRSDRVIPLNQRSTTTTSSLSISCNTKSYNDNVLSNMQQCRSSPVVSIRSIDSTIVTTDSDSDLNSDSENYYIKRLGTQVTYSPNEDAIPNINRGRRILNQKSIANTNQVLHPPLAVMSISGAAQCPPIGTVALSNASDVTFGDKHFYEGPVTIQQFLIDSPQKSKEANGKENTTLPNPNVGNSANNDPYMSNIRQKWKTTPVELEEEAKQLLEDENQCYLDEIFTKIA